MAGEDRRSGAEGEAPKVAPTRLPMTGPVFVGREAELGWLDACWDEGVHVASIVAWGGVGKSTLVGTWRNRLRDAGWRGAERVFDWSFYSQGTGDQKITSADAFVSAALRWFGDPDPTAGSPWDKGERLAELVKSTRTLLILDGMEPLQGGPGFEEGSIKDPALQTLVRGLAGENHGLCVITTRLGVADLASLSGEKIREKKLEHLSAEAGAELLRKRGVKGSDEELREAAEEYKGHCLALMLLGTYLEEACEGDIRRRKEIGSLEEEERLGWHARRVMTAYQRWFQGGPEVAILRMLGLFDGPAEEGEIGALREAPGIEGLTDALTGLGKQKWNKALARLRRAGLLAADAQDNRLDAHPLVREHFGEQVRQASPAAWREGHRRLYEHLEKTAKPLPETIEEMAPLYAAVVHGCQAGKHQEALGEVYWKRIQRGNEHFNSKKLGAFGSEVAVLSAFFDPPWERLASAFREPGQVVVLHEAGVGLGALGRLPEATGLLRLALERTIAQEAWENAAAAASNLSELLQARGELTEALSVARQSVALADRSGDAFRRMFNRTTLAAALHAMGHRSDAAVQFEEAERMQKEQQPRVRLLYSFQGFRYCDLLLDQGRYAEVRERAAKAVEIAARNHWLLDIAREHLSLGRAHLLAAQRAAAADLAPATAHLPQAVEGLRRAGEHEFILRGLLARADLHTFTRAFVAARRDLAESFTLAIRCGFRLHEADAHLGYARLHLAEADPIAAREHLGKARAIIHQTGYHRRDEELARLEAQAPAAPPVNPSSLESETSPTAIAEQGPAPMTAAPNDRFDVAILCALRKPELEKVLHLGSWKPLPSSADDATSYRETTYVTKAGKSLRVVAAAPTQMGMPASAVLATKMILRFRPRLVAMVGIAAGVKTDEQGFGDILAPDYTLDYGAGKATEHDGKLHFKPDPNPLPIQPRLRDRLKDWSSDRRHLEEIYNRWPAKKPREALQLHVGPLGSGAAVLNTRQPIDDVRDHWRKLIGVEMEAYGVHLACREAAEPQPAFLCVKSICDFAADKTDDWQDYAAYTAAELCHRFLTEEWENLYLDPR